MPPGNPGDQRKWNTDISEEVVGVIVSISMRDGMTEHTPSDFALLRRDALWEPVLIMSQDTACAEGN